MTTEVRVPCVGDRVRLKKVHRHRYVMWYDAPTGVVTKTMPSRYHEGRTAVCVQNDKYGSLKWFTDDQLDFADIHTLDTDETAVALARAVLNGDGIAARALADRVIELID